MENLTSQQATDLSNCLLELNNSIEDFRFDTTKKLSYSQKQTLDVFMDHISTYGQNILALSTTLVMNEVDESLTKIRNVTNQINATLNTLTNIQKCLDVAAAVVTLGSAIISKNPESIVNAISGLVNIWDSK